MSPKAKAAVSFAAAASLSLTFAIVTGACATAEHGFTGDPEDGGALGADGTMGGPGAPGLGEGGFAPDGAPLPAKDGSALPPGQDGSVPPGADGSVPPGEGGGGGGNDAAGASDGAQGACNPGTYRCSAGGTVEICNSSGTAWLYSSTCTVGCANGLCTGQCNPGDKRCNASNVEQCNQTGTAWDVQQACPASCTAGACDLVGLDVGINKDLDGEIWVDGAVVVHSGATLSSPSGNLTIHAKSILVENGGSIAVAPKGATAAGAGNKGYYDSYYGRYYSGGGGGYGTAGGANGGGAFGSDVDAVVQQGSAGGDSYNASYGGVGAKGGGVLRLLAPTIGIAGQITANGANGGNDTSGYGGGGGGSGGGILIAGDSVTISGSVSATGGSGGTGGPGPSNGGSGRVKVLYGATHAVTGSLTGQVTQALLPPIGITSASHPDSALVYNDDFATLALSWSKAFPSSQGYYVLVDQSAVHVPTPTAGVQFIATDFTSFPRAALAQGANYFHIAPVDATSNVGTAEGTFEIQINTNAPQLSSSSHPDATQWVQNPNAYFQWGFPQGDSNVVGAYYLFDAYGTTMPTSAATFVPVGQKQLLRSNIPNGVWVMHVVSVDHRGYLTRNAAHYRVNIGMDPGTGGVLGQVVDATSQPVQNATVTVNRGLYTQTTSTTGNFNFNSVPAGTFEIAVSATGHNPVAKTVTVVAGSPTTANLTLP